MQRQDQTLKHPLQLLVVTHHWNTPKIHQNLRARPPQGLIESLGGGVWHWVGFRWNMVPTLPGSDEVRDLAQVEGGAALGKWSVEGVGWSGGWFVGAGATTTNQPTNMWERNLIKRNGGCSHGCFIFFGGAFWKPGMFSNCFKLEIILPEEVWRFGGRFFLIRFGGLWMTTKAAKWIKGDAGINTTWLVGACQPIPKTILFGKGLWWSFRDFALSNRITNSLLTDVILTCWIFFSYKFMPRIRLLSKETQVIWGYHFFQCMVECDPVFRLLGLFCFLFQLIFRFYSTSDSANG